MQIVIEIDDDNYATIQEEYKEESMRENGEISNETVNIILDAFYKGTVLPKHGRLADLDAALKCVDDDSLEPCDAKWQAIRLFDWAMSKRVVLEAWGNEE